MDDLKNPTLKRPMDREAMSNDALSLRALVGFLNNPLVTGAVAPPPEEESPRPPAAVEKAKADSMIEKLKRDNARAAADEKRLAKSPPPPLPKSGPVASTITPIQRRLLFTGLPRTGKSWLATHLGARVFEFDDPIFSLAASAFGEVPAADLGRFVPEVRAWGEGAVNDKYPLTATRALFIEYMRSAGKQGDLLFGVPVSEFGTAGFWTNCLLARATRFTEEFPKELLVVTDVTEAGQYTALKEGGFLPFHITSHPMTRSARGGSNVADKLAGIIERDITQKVSQSPAGKRLWCVWCDEKYPTPSARFYSVADFLQAFTS